MAEVKKVKLSREEIAKREIGVTEVSKAQKLFLSIFFLLVIGIFLGAIWANVSWGNYWSWDPKEVWALITLLIYAAPLHEKLWKSFQKPLFFHIYGILAFLSVLITYFGVNMLLGGVHAYN